MCARACAVGSTWPKRGIRGFGLHRPLAVLVCERGANAPWPPMLCCCWRLAPRRRPVAVRRPCVPRLRPCERRGHCDAIAAGQKTKRGKSSVARQPLARLRIFLRRFSHTAQIPRRHGRGGGVRVCMWRGRHFGSALFRAVRGSALPAFFAAYISTLICPAGAGWATVSGGAF